MATREEEQLAARKWLAEHLEREGIKWDSLSKAQQFQMVMQIPCHIRCFRCGEPVDVTPGEECPECGKPRPKLSQWDHILSV